MELRAEDLNGERAETSFGKQRWAGGVGGAGMHANQSGSGTQPAGQRRECTHVQRCDCLDGEETAPFFAASEIRLENSAVATCAPQKMVNRGRAESSLCASAEIRLEKPAAAVCVPQKDGIFLEREKGAPGTA